jgi:hypothetical protein
VAIPLASGFASAPATLIDGNQMPIVEVREGDPELVALVRARPAGDSELDGGMVAVRTGRKGKRAEYRCAVCGYGIVVYGRPPGCPMCSEARWQHVEWRFSQPLDVAVPFCHPRPATSPVGAVLANGRGADSLPSTGSSRASLEK